MGRFLQLFSYIRISNIDKRLGSLRQVPSLELSNAKFRYHILRMCAGSDYTGTYLQGRDNLGDPFVSGRLERTNRFSARRQGCTSHKVHLTTHTRVHGSSDAVGADLA